ncbi:MAG: TnpV protein [Oscillospiraceae bacterium]|nr:TnpV protein [Oscillospiraceae bacterium]
MKSLFEEYGGKYIQCGDYLIPDLGLSEQEQKLLGKYGRMRRDYLEKNHSGLYTRMILNGTLMAHLQEIDETCHKRLEQMISQMAKAEGVTEALKAKDQMAWVQKMNSLHACAKEILLNELIYT